MRIIKWLLSGAGELFIYYFIIIIKLAYAQRSSREQTTQVRCLSLLFCFA